MEEFVVKLQLDEKDSCLLYLKSGKLIIDDVLFQHSYMNQQFHTIVPSIILCKNTESVINNCELVGNKEYYTTGNLILDNYLCCMLTLSFVTRYLCLVLRYHDKKFKDP